MRNIPAYNLPKNRGNVQFFFVYHVDNYILSLFYKCNQLDFFRQQDTECYIQNLREHCCP